MIEEMKNDPWLGPVVNIPSPPRGYVHLSPEATDQLNRIEEMLKRLIGEDESLSADGSVSIADWLELARKEPDAVVTITEDGRTMYEVDKP